MEPQKSTCLSSLHSNDFTQSEYVQSENVGYKMKSVSYINMLTQFAGGFDAHETVVSFNTK